MEHNFIMDCIYYSEGVRRAVDNRGVLVLDSAILSLI